MAQTPLGEQIRIGDIIQQELEQFQSRRICTVKASQGIIKRGQILAGDFTKTAPNVTTGSGDLTACGANEVQTVTIGTGGVSGGFTAGIYTLQFIDYLGQFKETDLINFNDNTAAVQAAVTAALGASAVTVGTVTVGAASTAMTYTLTFDGTNYAGKPQTLVRVNVTTDIVDAAGGIATVAKTTLVGATCIALEELADVSAVQKLLCLVRTAMVKPRYLMRTNAGVALTAADKASLEANSGILVMGGPTYRTTPDGNLTETATVPAGPQGL